MGNSGQAYLSWVGAWLVGFVALAAGMDCATAASLLVACRPEQPIVRAGNRVTMHAWASAPEEASLRYVWTVEAGRVAGQGAEVIWDLAEVRQSPIPYKAEVRILGSGGMTADCKLRVFVAPPFYGVEDGGRGGREAGRLFLSEDQPEAEGYGLYSYLLFGSPPSGGVQGRYLEAIAAYLRLVPHLAALEKYFKPRELNVIYLPTQKPPPDTEAVTPEWILIHYDYARARYWMRALPGTNRAGPYLVSTLHPLSQTTAAPERYLFQDLSAVPPHLVSLWVEEFLNQAAQEQFWREATASALAVRMRTAIAQLAIALPEVQAALKRLELPDIGTGVKDWIAWRSP
jgi:hypothetical protein